MSTDGFVQLKTPSGLYFQTQACTSQNGKPEVPFQTSFEPVSDHRQAFSGLINNSFS